MNFLNDFFPRECNVYLLQPTATNPNESLIELLIMADAVRRASAKRITAVVPCFGLETTAYLSLFFFINSVRYSRQDKKEKSRAAISAKLIANMMEKAGIQQVLTVDLQ